MLINDVDKNEQLGLQIEYLQIQYIEGIFRKKE
jgi:hypothetical protein